jgi:hypothetical protein
MMTEQKLQTVQQPSLVEINQKLTRQIENNVNLLESLNYDLKQKDQMLSDTKYIVNQKD